FRLGLAGRARRLTTSPPRRRPRTSAPPFHSFFDLFPAARAASGYLLPTRRRRRTPVSRLTQHRLTQHLQIPTQHCQANVTRQTTLTVIATTLQTVARLQRMNRGFDPPVPLPPLPKPRRRRRLLFRRLLGAPLRHTRLHYHLGHLLLILRRVKTPVERGPHDPTRYLGLRTLQSRYTYILILLTTTHQLIMDDVTELILQHQHLPPKLHRRAHLTLTNHLRVRLKHAQNFLQTRDLFAEN